MPIRQIDVSGVGLSGGLRPGGSPWGAARNRVAGVFLAGLLLLLFHMAAPPLGLALEANEARDKLYKSLETRKAIVFVAQCGDRAASHSYLILDTEGNRWELVDEMDTGEFKGALSVSEFPVAVDGVYDVAAGGGLISYQVVHDKLEVLTHSGFDLLAPFTVEALRDLQIRKPTCNDD